jgi:hypothetical protein
VVAGRASGDLIGGEVWMFAMPLLALTVLCASPLQAAMLTAVGAVVDLVGLLPAGRRGGCGSGE